MICNEQGCTGVHDTSKSYSTLCPRTKLAHRRSSREWKRRHPEHRDQERERARKWRWNTSVSGVLAKTRYRIRQKEEFLQRSAPSLLQQQENA
jgi:hypothetical protein